MHDPIPTDVLVGLALSIAVVHTLIGVDHSLPFAILARARGWTLARTLGLTALCGLGHVLSSIALGLAGIGVGATLDGLVSIEASRGNLAAWLLIGFGIAYAAWSAVRLSRGRIHGHVHVHEDGSSHDHHHDHKGEHLHFHGARLTSWALFVIFVLGPCEPLIPLLMAPAAEGQAAAVALVATVFGVATIGTMCAVVAVLHAGLGLRRFPGLERHQNTLAGLAIAVSGLAVLATGA